MKQIVTKGIILTRIDFQEADRILTLLTPDHGKVRLMAKGVRKVKSKLAGGIELFSISQITFLPGRGEIKTLVSSRLQTHFGNIVKDINRTMLGYEFLKRINKITEDGAEPAYFDLLAETLEGLDDNSLSNDEIEFWHTMQLLKIGGHAPNLRIDANNEPLRQDGMYQFDYDLMAFQLFDRGSYSANHIKLLRLGVGSSKPSIFTKVQDSKELMPEAFLLCKNILGLQMTT